MGGNEPYPILRSHDPRENHFTSLLGPLSPPGTSSARAGPSDNLALAAGLMWQSACVAINLGRLLHR